MYQNMGYGDIVLEKPYVYQDMVVIPYVFIGLMEASGGASGRVRNAT